MKVGIVYDTLKESKGHHGTHFAFTGLPDVELVLADPNPNPEYFKAIGAERHYLDYREMLDYEKPEITLLCSRLPNDHEPVLTAALQQGSHVMCEKPLAALLSEADRMAKLAKEKNLLISVAHLARYSPVFITVKKLIKQGLIGKPLTFYGRGKEDERGGGEDLLVLGTHILDLGNFLFGKPKNVFANVMQNNQPIKPGHLIETSEEIGPVAGDEICAVFRYENAINAFFESRRNLFRKQTRMGITIVGTEASLSVRYDNERYIRLSRSQYPPEDEAAYEIVPVETAEEIPAAKPLNIDFGGNAKFRQYFTVANRYAAWDMIQAIREKRQPRCNIEDAQIVLEMIYGIYASQLKGKRIDFPLKERKHPLKTE